MLFSLSVSLQLSKKHHREVHNKHSLKIEMSVIQTEICRENSTITASLNCLVKQKNKQNHRKMKHDRYFRRFCHRYDRIPIISRYFRYVDPSLLPKRLLVNELAPRLMDTDVRRLVFFSYNWPLICM